MGDENRNCYLDGGNKKVQEKSYNINVVIVIDSNLGNLEGYNNRTIPIFGLWILPENYLFMYATAYTSENDAIKLLSNVIKLLHRD